MTDIAGDQKSDKVMEDVGEDFWVGTYDKSLQFINSAAGTSTILNRFAFQFELADFSSVGLGSGQTPNQWNRLQWMMNLYQEMQFESIRWTYKPRWKNVFPTGAVYDPGSTGLSYYPTILEAQDTAGFSGSFQQPKEMCFITDKTDVLFNSTGIAVTVKASPDFDEFLVARVMSNATNFMSTEFASGLIHPYEYDLTSSYGQYAWGNSIINNNTNFGMDASAPQRSPWKATRSFYIGTSSLDAYPNIATTYQGLKMFVYDPWNFDTTAIPYGIGIVSLTYKVRFRGREFRSPFQATTFAGLSDEERKKVEEIKAKYGHRGDPSLNETLSVRFIERERLRNRSDADTRPSPETQRSSAPTAPRSNPVSELLSKRPRTLAP